MGDKLLLKLNIYGKPIANKYCEGKMKRTLKKGLKDLKSLKSKAWQKLIGHGVLCEEATGFASVKFVKGFYLQLQQTLALFSMLNRQNLVSAAGISLLGVLGPVPKTSESSRRPGLRVLRGDFV